MQSSLVQRPALANAARGPASSARRMAIAKPGRMQSVQVFAKKGKGKGVIRQSAGVSGSSGNVGPGQQQMAQQMTDAQVPEIDPEQVEWVLFVRGLKVPMAGGKLVNDTPWLPMSIMRGGPGGTTLSKFMETGFGRKLYSNLLIRQIGQSLYKDKEGIATSLRKSYPPLSGVATRNLRFAFKVRDKARPASWKDAENLTEVPGEEEVQGTGFDALKAFFSGENLSKLFSSN